ncbi:MAG TPA: hypothetical protein DIU23_03180 [Candidatus Pacebacteria bacterium]|nr:hypothetical protein [Candidatus Paceibacterota bacterium]
MFFFTDLNTYYRSLSSPFRSVLFYVLKAYAVFLLITLIVFSFFIDSYIRTNLNALPETFSLSYTHSTLSANGIALPYILKFPNTIGTLQFYDTYMKQTSVDGQETHTAYVDIVPKDVEFTANKKDIGEMGVPMIQIGLGIVTMSIWPFFILARMMWAALYALFVTTIAQWFRRSLPYTSVYKLSVTTMVTAELIHGLGFVLYRGNTQVPLFDLAFAVIMIVVLKTLPPQTAQGV